VIQHGVFLDRKGGDRKIEPINQPCARATIAALASASLFEHNDPVRAKTAIRTPQETLSTLPSEHEPTRRLLLRGAGLATAGLVVARNRPAFGNRGAGGAAAAGARVGSTGAGGAAGAGLPSAWPATLIIQPLGPVSNEDLSFIVRALGATFDFRFQRQPEQSMPAEAYYLPRQRYRAELVLEALGRQTTDRILGVTALDISTTKEPYTDWGIIGLGTIGGRTCVISSFRCKQRAPNVRAATVRLAKTAVHEVGHTLGLEHCPNRGCLMEDADGSILTSDRDTDLCATCRDRLAARGVIVKRPAFRWTR
jgi:archaemetzincin